MNTFTPPGRLAAPELHPPTASTVTRQLADGHHDQPTPTSTTDPTGEHPVNDTPPTVTEVRTALIRETADFHRRRQAHHRVMHDTRTQTGTAHDTAFDAYEGLVAAGCFAETLATVLRIVAERHPETANDLATLIDDVRENGSDGLDGANDDIWALIEREARAAQDAVDAEIAAADSEMPTQVEIEAGR